MTETHKLIHEMLDSAAKLKTSRALKLSIVFACQATSERIGHAFAYPWDCAKISETACIDASLIRINGRPSKIGRGPDPIQRSELLSSLPERHHARHSI